MLFTTSWDDGRKDDLQLAALLEKYGATGTFYVSPPSTHKKTALSDADIRMLSERHEIGAHTITHPRLTRLSPDEARREITESKRWIESITGKSCGMFCYPGGDENSAVRNLVRGAGFRGARTVRQFAFKGTDPFAIPTTWKVYPLPLTFKYSRLLPLSAGAIWLIIAKMLFSYARRTHRPFFHLWGHSWEIEQYGMWGHLEKFLKYVSEQPGITYTCNSALLSHS